MKKTILLFVVSIAILFCFCACQNDASSGPTYTVWTDFVLYSEFTSSTGQTLNDGMYVRAEISNSDWAKASATLTSEGHHYWKKSDIIDWFIGRGFGDYEASKEAAWLTTIDHGTIFSRTDNLVYVILK